MGADQRQRELLDLVEERPEATVLRDPCADLRNQVFRDVDGAGLAAFLVGDVLRSMKWAAVLAAALRAAAAVGVESQRSRPQRPRRSHLVESTIEHAADERGMIGYAHRECVRERW